MSLTQEQELMARYALLNKATDNLRKQQAFDHHNTACKWVTEYGLPYRVSLDYLKTHSKDDGIVLINPCYPLPGYPVDGILTITGADLDYDNPNLYTVDEKGVRTYKSELFYSPNAGAAEEIRVHNLQFRTWDLETVDGLTAWEYEFAHFLDGYDIDRFTAFDTFGRGNVSDNALDAFKRTLKAIQHRFKANKQSYRTSEPVYLPEYDELYTVAAFKLKLY